MKNKYDTSVVFLYASGNENLLPEAFRKTIPYSTISTWRKIDLSKYIGNEFRSYFDEAFKIAHLVEQNKQLRQTLFALARSWITLSSTIIPTLLKARNDKKLQTKILSAIYYLNSYMSLKQVLKLFGISKALYDQWVLESKFTCFDSFNAICVKRHPHQLQLKEINKIKKALADPKFEHWPIVSIQSFAFRKKRIVASLDSWYKYANLFGVKRKLVKKQLKTVGLVATYPNEYWHVDTTFYPLTNGTKACLTILMDNYSKMILGYHISYSNNFKNVKHTIKRALQNVKLHPNINHTFLVADGGRENHNKNIEEFIAKLSNYKITKIRSLKDIKFSNSPIEAVHRTLKGRYLKNKKFDSIKELKLFIKWAVDDYNILRPHYRHRS